MLKFVSVLASRVFAIFAGLLGVSAIVKGDDGLAAVALAILALVFKLEAELPLFKEILRQRRN